MTRIHACPLVALAVLASAATAHAEPELRIRWQPRQVAPGERVELVFGLTTHARTMRPELWWSAEGQFGAYTQGEGPAEVALEWGEETEFTMSFVAPETEGEVKYYLRVEERGFETSQWRTRPIVLPVRRSERPYGLTRRTQVEGLSFPALAPPPPVGFEPVFTRLELDHPLWLGAPADGSDRIFVAEMPGRIQVFPNRDDAPPGLKTTFLDITDRVKFNRRFEQGLLGVAFHPDYAQNGHVFVHYIKRSEVDGNVGSQFGDEPRKSVVARFTVDPSDPNRCDPASEHVILEWPQPGPSHNAGGIAFGPDGMLYIGVADGAWAMTTDGALNTGKQAQDLTSLLGSILRIDVDGADPYAIPSDNPFFVDGSRTYQGVPTHASPDGEPCEEIYSYGHRNPWRLAFDRETGELYEGEIGQVGREEINIIEKGGNYGWNAFEGPGEFNGNKAAFNPGPHGAKHTPPFFSYDYGTLGKSVIGGFVYRGERHREKLDGLYVFGDFASHKVFAMDPAVRAPNLVGSIDSLSSFGEDEAGEVYAVSLDQGRIYRLGVREGEPAEPMPARLSQTGLFELGAAGTLEGELLSRPGIIEYDVNAPLWSDDAKKRRWVALPGWDKIVWSASGAWEYPTGTVLIKHFELGQRRLETRVLIRHENGWQGYTYIWNEAQDDAELFTGDDSGKGLTVDYPEGRWTFPSQADCMSCHNAASGYVLGPKTGQLNGDFAYANGVVDNQLRAWDHIGVFAMELHQPEKKLWGPVEKVAQLLENLSLITRSSPPRKFQSLPLEQELARLDMGWDQLERWVDPYLDETLEPGALYQAYRAEGKRPAPAGAPFAASLLEARARSYLAVNCSHCHTPGGSGDSFDARFLMRLPESEMLGAHSKKGYALSTLTAAPNGLFVAPQASKAYDPSALSPGYVAQDQLRIRGGDHSLSTVWLRPRLLDQNRMPPIGTSQLDERGLALLAAWIDSLGEQQPAPTTLEAGHSVTPDGPGVIQSLEQGQ